MDKDIQHINEELSRLSRLMERVEVERFVRKVMNGEGSSPINILVPLYVPPLSREQAIVDLLHEGIDNYEV